MTLTTNKSFLSNNKFEFKINRLPNTVFFVQSVNLPTITLGNTTVASPYVTINRPSNLLTFEPLTINYIMDENMAVWFEIYDWIKALGNPTSLDKLGNLSISPTTQNSITSDAALIIKTNANNPNIIVNFKDIFPTDLSGVQFSTIDSQEFLTSSITFQYTYYTIEKI